MTTTAQQVLDAVHHQHYAASNGIQPRWLWAQNVRAGAGFDGRAADAIALDAWPSGHHALHGFEVKISRGDWLRELRQPEKCEPVRRYCDRWWLAAPEGIAAPEELPDGWGLLQLQGGRVRVTVEAPVLRPEPWPRGFIVALSRAAVRTDRHRVVA